MAMNILLASGAGRVNGAAATITSVSPVIQTKNERDGARRGVVLVI